MKVVMKVVMKVGMSLFRFISAARGFPARNKSHYGSFNKSTPLEIGGGAILSKKSKLYSI